MMRLPWFSYHAPGTLAEAARMLAGEGPGAMAIAGGTDLLPNMKRRHQLPTSLVSLRHVDELRTIRNGSGLTLGAGLTLAAVVASPLHDRSGSVASREQGSWRRPCARSSSRIS